MAKKQILAPTLFITLFLYVLFPWLSFNNIHFLMFNFEFHRFEFLFMAFEASTHQLIYIVAYFIYWFNSGIKSYNFKVLLWIFLSIINCFIYLFEI
jgi:hypothetical protein